MVSSNSSYLVIICLYIVIWFQVFLTNTSILEAILWIRVTSYLIITNPLFAHSYMVSNIPIFDTPAYSKI